MYERAPLCLNFGRFDESPYSTVSFGFASAGFPLRIAASADFYSAGLSMFGPVSAGGGAAVVGPHRDGLRSSSSPQVHAPRHLERVERER